VRVEVLPLAKVMEEMASSDGISHNFKISDSSQQRLSSQLNLWEDITKVAPAAIREEEVRGNVIGIISLAQAKELKLIFDSQDARLPYGVTRQNKWSVPIIPDDFQD
jgi:hypothetical protein